MAFMLLKPVFKATVGLLVSKGRSLAAEKLKDGDVADEKFRQMIVREMDDIKSKLDGLAGKDLAASISFFNDGVVYLGKVLDVETAGNKGSDAVSTQADGTVGKIVREEKTVLLAANKMKNLQLTDLNETTRKNLSEAKERFKDARRKAIEAFGNSALSTSDRLLAMAIRIVATLLEQVEDLANALASCRLCLEELHTLSAVQENFSVELKKGIKSKFGKNERKEIIVAVCQVNRVIYDVIEMVDEGASKARDLLTWPCVDVGDEWIDPLRDSRIARKLRKLGMEQFCVQPWSFGQEGEEEHRLKSVKGIAINTKGQFIIVDENVVKTFDSSGEFLNSFCTPEEEFALYTRDVATDRDDNMYVLYNTTEGRGAVYVFDKEASLNHSFFIRPGYLVFLVTVDRLNNNVLVTAMNKQCLRAISGGIREDRELLVEVYENHGRLLHRIEVMCKYPDNCHISSTGDGRVMVLDPASHTLHLFSTSEGYPLEKKIQLRQASPEDRPNAMTFHQASEQLVIASLNDKTNIFRVSLYNRDGDYVRSIPLEDVYCIKRIVMTNNGRIALVDVRLSVPKTRIIIV